MIGRIALAGLLCVPLVSRAQTAPAEIRIEGIRPVPPALLDPIEMFGSDFIQRTDAFTADEVLTQLAASLPSGQQVVFIDGHESTVDISTIPAERIERIEVSTSGVMPDGRPRIFGTVINIILKEKYNGANFGARSRNSFAGGGGQSQLNAFGGFTAGRFSGILNLIHREQDPLLASERDFSAIQDHTGIGGADYRAPYGTAAVVQAVTGPLNGVTDTNGLPTSIALSPDTPSGHALSPADFIAAPAGTFSAAGLRHFSTADFLYLVAPSKSDVVNSELTFSLNPNVKLHAGYTYQRSQSQQSGPPPITPVSPLSVVPAAYNPFGQDVEVGLVHSGFGGVQRESAADRKSGYFAVDGHSGTTWDWGGRFELNHRVSTSETHDLDAVKFAAALAAADPAERFDPFTDAGPGSANAALYPSLTTVRRSEGTADDTRFRASGRGQVSDGWIAPIYLRIAMDRSTNDSRQNLDPGAANGPDIITRSRLTSMNFNANLDVPAFRARELEPPAMLSLSAYVTNSDQSLNQQVAGVPQQQSPTVKTSVFDSTLNIPWSAPADTRPWAYDLQTQVGIGLSRADGETSLTENAGGLWSPVKSFTLRGNYSRQRAPAPTNLYPLTVDYNQILIDRLRDNTIANNVQVSSNQPDAQGPPLISRLLLSLQWTPAALAKLRLILTYSDVTQKGQLRSFTAQDILDNEAALPGRVIRLPPTADDIAAGLPGDIVQVDITPFTAGLREDRSLIFQAQYSNALPKLGTVTFRSTTQHRLSSTNEIIPGVPIVSTNDQEAPPAWTCAAQAEWQLGKWSSGSSLNYVSGGQYAGLPYASFGTLDARVGYQVEKPLGGWLGKTLRIGAGIQNLLNKDPPFANTITGFRGGSPLGRTYELTLRAAVGD